jgi:hypothetical protein
MSKKIIAVDSQKLSMVQMCGYKYDLTFNRSVIPAEKQDFFEKGDLMHKMMQTYYSMHKYTQRWPNSFTRDKIFKIIERVGEWYAIQKSLPQDEIEECIWVFGQYLDYYWGERSVTLAVEQVASKMLYEDDELAILYDAKIDWICSLGNSPILPVDHKTSSRRGNTIAISNQFMGYCWILGVSNIMVNKIGFQKTVKPADKFTRPIMSYPLGVIDGWVKNSVYWIKQILQYEEQQFWPQNFTSCDKYSGCIFHDLCEAPPETRAAQIAANFDIRPEPWDVGAKL